MSSGNPLPFVAPREGVFPIPLTRGMTAWVDAEDYPKVAGLRWQPLPANGGKFYAKAGRYPTLLLHRVIMDAGDDELIDHEDGNGLHCWRSNLRRATPAQNQFNRASMPGSSSRFKGVVLTPTGRWRAKIRANNVEYRLGTFESEEVAARAYDNSARELHGEFARLNFPDRTEAA